MQGSVRGVIGGLFAAGALALAAPAAHAQTGAWSPVSGPPSTSSSGAKAEIEASSMKAFTLDSSAMQAKLRSAPKIGLKQRSLAASSKTIISLPRPDGTMQRFQVEESPIMEAGLAAEHPEIKTYAGVGLDDPDATVRADTTPLGFHASVRSPDGAWYVDPYYHLDDSVYVSYFGRDLANAHGGFEEGDIEAKSDPLDLGVAAAAGPEIQLRTYRLALTTDQSYATYFGGPANVTAAKVTLMNRVDQIYEDETAIRMILINDTDKLNLDTDAQAIGANGPCGSSACFTTAQLSTCAGATLNRNRIVIGQIIGASNYDIGHIGLGKNGGGVASLGVVGGNSKAQGCTGLPTPVGDFYAVDYVAHEMGHQFAGNHTFNGTQSNCSTGNRNPDTSVEPGSGSSIMAYAGICQTDNLQPHSDPYWSQRSFDEITAYTSSTRPPINEVQTISLRDFDGTDSLVLRYGAAPTPAFVRGANYTLADMQRELQGISEVQTAALTSYDANDDSYTLNYKGANSVPIVRGQNNTAAGIQNALQGGNEQQQVTLTGFNGATQSFRVQIGGQTSPLIGFQGAAVSSANITGAINRIPGFAGTASVSGAGNGGFTVTFGGASAGTDVPAISIVNCTGGCTSLVRETAKGGAPIAGWPDGGTVAAANVADTGYTLTFSGSHQGLDVADLTVTNGSGASGTVTQTTAATRGVIPPGASAVVAAFGGSGALNDTGFQVTFGGILAGTDLPPLGLTVTGGTGFVGETARGGPIQNQGAFVTRTGNHAPDVTVPAGYTIPPRTPFALTGSATDPDGDQVTYMWEQNDVGTFTVEGGTGLVNNTKTNGPLFRQFGTYANVSASDTLLTPSPGENAVDRNPTRVFPDMSQIMIDNTNASTGTCPTAGPNPVAVPVIDCFSEFLPTADWVGVLSDRQLTFRLTARDGRVGGGGIGSAQTKLTVAPLAAPFRVTSQSIPQSIYATAPARITWLTGGTEVSPINVANVKISLSTDGGATWPYVVAASTPNDGSADVIMPNVVAPKARVKVEALGNVFFDVNHTDFALTAPPTGTVGGNVPATLSLTLGTPASFGAFQAGLTKDYDALMSANVISTAGDATLSVADPSTNVPGHLVNGAFSLPSALMAKANAGTYSTVGSAPANLLMYSAPISNDNVTIGLRQHIDANDALRTGTYSKTLTFTLSTTTP
jgi:Metallo-peptidase family M12B Reprolysin-like